MSTPPDDAIEQLIRSGLRRHAASAPDHPDLHAVGERAARYRRRRYVQGAGVASTVLVVVAALVFVTGSSPRASTTHDAIAPGVGAPKDGPVTGSLVLPLTDTVQAGGLQLEQGGGGSSAAEGPGDGGRFKWPDGRFKCPEGRRVSIRRTDERGSVG